jgi:hypothetical protein
VDRLKAVLPDGTGVSYFSRSAAARPPAVGGRWIWRSSDGRFQYLDLEVKGLADDKVLQLALDIYRGSIPFLDAVYGADVVNESEDPFAGLLRLIELGIGPKQVDAGALLANRLSERYPDLYIRPAVYTGGVRRGETLVSVLVGDGRAARLVWMGEPDRWMWIRSANSAGDGQSSKAFWVLPEEAEPGPAREVAQARALLQPSIKFLDEFVDSVLESAGQSLRSKLRLHQLGMASENLSIISIAVNWDAERESEPVFTYRDYYEWPGSLEYDRWSEHLDHFEGQIRDWMGAEAQGLSDREVFRQWPRFSERVLPMLLKWLRREDWAILHLSHEGQFYDIKTGELIGEGTVTNPKWFR